MPKASKTVEQIVRMVEVTDDQAVNLMPTPGGWKFVIAHPSHTGRRFYYISIPSELIIKALNAEGVTTSFARRV